MFVLPQVLKDHLLPHPQGLRRAKALHHSAFAYYIGLFLTLGLFFRYLPEKAPGVFGFTTNITSEEIVTLTNIERSQLSLDSLTVDPRLTAAAYAKGQDMLEDDYWAHTAPDGATPWDFILQQGFDYIYAGENLAKDFSFANDTVRAWMKSPTHKANIINPKYEKIGVAVVTGDVKGEEVAIIVQMFGTELETSSGNLKEPSADTSLVSPPGTQTNTQSHTSYYPAGNSIAGLEDIFTSAEIKVSRLNKFTAAKEITVVLIGILMFLLIVDTIYVHKKKIRRLAGHNLAHVLMLLFAFVGILGSGMGSII